MEIKRDIVERLLEWKESEDRRPLLIQGARQIGKTWVMKHFGKSHYDYLAYFNFDASPELGSEFKQSRDPKRLISRLSLYCDSPIIPGKTLIVFDEIQESSDALNSLKYFCEEAPEYHIMAAGSLLGVAIHSHSGFPVGKVDFIKMYPVSFKEYLRARYPETVEYIDNMEAIEPLPEILRGKLEETYRAYMICGGMPKAAVASLDNQGIEKIVKEQREILTSYYLDFSKHAPTAEFPKIAAIWESLPSQLAKENRKFIYKVVKNGARAREYENALTWLREAGLLYQIFCCSKPGLPLSAFDDISAFKIYLLDIGLLRELAGIPPEIFNSANRSFVEFKGALTENYALQSLVPYFDQFPRYWVSSGKAEVDFLIQNRLNVIPVEVKSADNISSKSLSVYIGKYTPSVSVILSTKPLDIIENPASTKLLYLPIYLTDWLPKFLELTEAGPEA